jgi:TRAP transporter 4TM/12TM fusion protein
VNKKSKIEIIVEEKAKTEVVSRYRRLTGISKLISIVLSVAATGLAVLYVFRFTPGGMVLYDVAYFFLLIALLLPLTFLLIPATKKASGDKIPWYDFLAATLVFGIAFYFFLHAYDVIALSWTVIPPSHVYPLCFLLVMLLLEAGRRVAGAVFAAFIFFFAIFPLFANFMPGPLAGVSFSLPRLLTMHTFGSDSIIGIPMRVVGTLLMGYLIFAAVLQAAGGGRFFINVANAWLGHVRGGPAKVAVVASGFFGMISGSAVANVASTGAFTIPMMKRAGYPAHFAGAVEACASTGGVLMPPVMGATAFLIAEFLQIPYSQVVLAAFLPAFLYYGAIFIQVDARAAVLELKGLPRETLPSLKQTLKEGWFYIVALIFLIYILLIESREAEAPFYTILLLLALPMMSKATRLNRQHLIAGLEGTSRLFAEIMPTLLSIGLVIGSLTITGVAGALSTMILELSGGNVYLLLLLGAFTSFILGMGMSVTACYIILALLVAPALIKMGLDPLSVHLFVMYWGMISYITPPVAVAAFTAAAIAGASPMKVGYTAMRIGIAIYFIPFFFVLEPALIAHGSLWKILEFFSTAVLGIAFIGWASEGYIPKLGMIGLWMRLLFFIGGMLLFIPETMTDIIGLLLVILAIGLYLIRRKVVKVEAH